MTLDPSNPAPLALSTFIATLSSLKRVFFHHVVEWEARQIYKAIDTREVRYNRLYPLISQTEAFTLLNTDPRPIDADLTIVSIGIDPRETLCLWREIEARFQIYYLQPVEFLVLITAPSDIPGEERMVATRADANSYLKREEAGWAELWERGAFFERIGLENPNTPERNKQASMPVFGFWLFPVNAFGNLPDDGIRRTIKEIRDLTNHRPQLGVFGLPHDQYTL